MAAAVGDDAQLIAELRTAFAESARRDMAAVEQAASQADWEAATAKLKSLAGSFGAVRLMAAADDAGRAPVGDQDALRRLRRVIPKG
ncbi:MAG: Hpt domain-containing protein [Sphingomonas sp.]